MNTLYYANRQKVPPTPSGSEAFKKAERADKDGSSKHGERGI
jgi:hypothetical protein